MSFWNGKGRNSAQPFINHTTKDEHLVDFYGREFIIPAGSKCRHFETVNKGWIIWHGPDGKGHVRDVG